MKEGYQAMEWNQDRILRFKGSHTFRIADGLNHKLYWWPQTLLSYAIDFSDDPVAMNELTLCDAATQGQVSYQLSQIRMDDEGKVLFAQFSFLTDLESGGGCCFILQRGTPERMAGSIQVTEQGDSLWMDNGRFSVQIPASQMYPVRIPGPVMSVSMDGVSYGNSNFAPGRLKIIEINTVCEEMGPLFAQYAVRYTLDDEKTYTARLKLIKNMDYIELIEHAEGIGEHDDVSFQLYWSGLAPTHRHAPNNPVEISNPDDEYDQLNWCKIEEPYVSGYTHPLNIWSNQEDGELPFRLSLFEPQASIVRVNSAAFWNQVSGQSVGAFITDAGNWKHRKYDLFSSWDGFAVSFYYKNGLMWWKYPVMSGSRSTAIAVYPHLKDQQYYDSLRGMHGGSDQLMAGSAGIKHAGASYCTFLQIRYGLLSLDEVKDYVLEYPETSRRQRIDIDERKLPFTSDEEFEHYMMNYVLVSRLPTHGQRENAGFSPVPYRRMTKLFIPAYIRWQNEMPYARRKRIEAMLLLLTYMAASEHVAPLRHMYAGPPNLHGDVKRTLGYMAALFPDHPQATYWKDVFAQFIETSLRLFTRPDLPQARLQGGRWAENLGTYTWAFLIPALKTNILLQTYAGERNLFANKYTAMIGRWLVHSLTAPFDGENEQNMKLMGQHAHYWGCFAEGMGPHRVYLPIGAHAARRSTPASLRQLAAHLARYEPMLAEHIQYICSGLPDDFESRKPGIGTKKLGERDRWIRGTRPEFATTAFTGFGVMLRNGVYTPSEISVFVQQIDEGPNYRWGTAAVGGNGNIYYYAGGKAYSHNGLEDAGDRRLGDGEVGCHFAVWKNSKFSSIGQNVLTNGYHALGTFQYTAIEPEKERDSYSYPEYLERNVLLSGTDYISIHDKTSPKVAHRFIWSVSAFDKMPNIHILTPVTFTSRLTTGNQVSQIDSVWYEGRGDCFAIVSHRDDVTVERQEYGAVVSAAQFTDRLFRSHAPIAGRYDGVNFAGTAAAIRQDHVSGDTDVALIAGSVIQFSGMRLESETGRTGLALKRTASGEMTGHISSMQADRIAVMYEGNKEYDLYIDAVMQMPEEDGMHRIGSGQFTVELVRRSETARPARPVIEWIIQGDGCGEVHIKKANGAAIYEIQLSADYGETWHTVCPTRECRSSIHSLENGMKYFIRVRAVNGNKYSAWSHEYPVYPSPAKALPPEGLDVILSGEQLLFSWGRVLGASGYRLYRKKAGGETELIYAGANTQYTCARSSDGETFAYTVSALNLNGEGGCSPHEVSDDPQLLRNDKPQIESGFNRNTQYCHHPFILQHPHKFREVPSCYPDSLRGDGMG